MRVKCCSPKLPNWHMAIAKPVFALLLCCALIPLLLGCISFSKGGANEEEQERSELTDRGEISAVKSPQEEAKAGALSSADFQSADEIRRKEEEVGNGENTSSAKMPQLNERFIKVRYCMWDK